jgi:hypothetical protein
MSLKKKKKGNVSNISKSKKIFLSTFQLIQIQNPSPGDAPKEKRKGMLITFSNQKKHLFPSFNLLKSEIQVQVMFLKKKKKKH